MNAVNKSTRRSNAPASHPAASLPGASNQSVNGVAGQSMRDASDDASSDDGAGLLYRVKDSTIHGRGVFARRKIRAGTLVLEYCGDRISYDQACIDAAARDDESNHTFLFSLEDGRVIDGGRNGNDARWINHCCEPNCEAREEDGRVFIHALRDIVRGEELNYDYGLVLEERYTPAVKRAYACRCGKPGCRHTMLAPKKRSRKT